MTFETAETWDKVAKTFVKSIWADISLVARVRDMWGLGISAANIANTFCGEGLVTNRNAVIGLIHRHKFDGPMSRKNQALKPKPAPKPRVRGSKAARMSDAALASRPKPDWRGELILPASEGDALVAFGKPCRVWELEPSSCRWPLGSERDKGGTTFCNDGAIEGMPYCGPHMRCATKPHHLAASYGLARVGAPDGR
jgi:hypothetical protein